MAARPTAPDGRSHGHGPRPLSAGPLVPSPRPSSCHTSALPPSEPLRGPSSGPKGCLAVAVTLLTDRGPLVAQGRSQLRRPADLTTARPAAVLLPGVAARAEPHLATTTSAKEEAVVGFQPASSRRQAGRGRPAGAPSRSHRCSAGTASGARTPIRDPEPAGPTAARPSFLSETLSLFCRLDRLSGRRRAAPSRSSTVICRHPRWRRGAVRTDVLSRGNSSTGSLARDRGLQRMCAVLESQGIGLLRLSVGLDEGPDPCCFLLHLAASAGVNFRKPSCQEARYQGGQSERVRRWLLTWPLARNPVVRVLSRKRPKMARPTERRGL